MKILFLSLYNYEKNTRDIYADLLEEIKRKGHEIFIACPIERRLKENTRVERINGINVLKIKTLNIRKINIIEKAIATLSIEKVFIKNIKKYYDNEKFDLIIYTTPPITFSKVIEFLKRRDNSKSYLLLKDIFPQNAVDLKMIKKNGFIYNFFRKKEIELYKQADFIGCMSNKNIEYLLRENKFINSTITELAPNSIIPREKELNINKNKLREKNNLPKDKLIIAYGGNLGKPQGIKFLIEIIKNYKNDEEIFFFIAGDGTEYKNIENLIRIDKIKNVKLKKSIPKNEYDEFLKSCDIGLILLDKNFTIPNIPSRILSYMDFAMPVIAATDKNTDIGEIIEENNFGYWCESGDLDSFNKILENCLCNKDKLKTKGNNGRRYLENNYTAKHSADIILKHFD